MKVPGASRMVEPTGGDNAGFSTLFPRQKRGCGPEVTQPPILSTEGVEPPDTHRGGPE